MACPQTRIVDRARLHAIERRHDALVFFRIERLIGFDIFVTFSIAIGVDDEWSPALRLLLIAGLLVHLRIQPAHHAAVRASGAGPQRVVGIVRKIEMLRVETRVD